MDNEYQKVISLIGEEVLKSIILTGNISDEDYDKLFDYYCDSMPYGTAKARSGDPMEWICQRLSSFAIHIDLTEQLILSKAW